MPKQLNIKAALLDAAAPKRPWQLMHILIVFILLSFVGKQSFDVCQQWEEVSMQLTTKMQAKIDLCLQEFHEKLCNSDLNSEKCKELLACIQAKPSLDPFALFHMAGDEVSQDFWFPASILTLMMLFRVSEAAGPAGKDEE